MDPHHTINCSVCYHFFTPRSLKHPTVGSGSVNVRGSSISYITAEPCFIIPQTELQLWAHLTSSHVSMWLSIILFIVWRAVWQIRSACVCRCIHTYYYGRACRVLAYTFTYMHLAYFMSYLALAWWCCCIHTKDIRHSNKVTTNLKNGLHVSVFTRAYV